MPAGKLLTFAEGKFDGIIEIQNYPKSTKLNSNSNKFFSVFEVRKNPQKIFLITSVEGRIPVTKWRIWVNQFSLTKEFKPNFDIQYNNKNYAIILYDITPVAREGKNELVIEYSGSTFLDIDNVSVISFYPVENFTTIYKLNIGNLLLKSSEVISFESLGKNLLLLRNPNNSKVLIKLNSNQIYKYEGPLDNEEIELDGKGELVILHEGESKNPLSITSFHTMEVNEPRMDIVIEGNYDSKSLRFSILNNGEINFDKIIINVMANGITYLYKICTDFKAGYKESFEVPIKIKKGVISIRVVGIKASIRKVIQKQIFLEN
jgi:hypothetical protein